MVLSSGGKAGVKVVPGKGFRQGAFPFLLSHGRGEGVRKLLVRKVQLEKLHSQRPPPGLPPRIGGELRKRRDLKKHTLLRVESYSRKERV